MASNAQKKVQNSASQVVNKYLTFALSGEKYGLDILKVQEIIGVLHITCVPKSPVYLKGVINLRGKIIPVVDLRAKFGLPETEYNEKTCIIVVNVNLSGRTLQVGVVVDTVLEVMAFAADRIEPAPEYGMQIDTNFITGMGRSNEDHIIILVDIEKALHDPSCNWATEVAKAEEEQGE